ncbi:YT521-B-like domain-containing protein [Boeremia exigua]|uniref:YT521-B-like domain-containing protein n=1 Tax=Boeremia exigua TaxID=749465 RepID=UPI001E8EC60A|nr:YT521-B-like domain-containing protein [Boeremia exigua]KAH6612640.1 YT521-B-like domain-containing protein [Boeremia exigua]
MSFVWVQQWFTVPVIVEGQMGDIPSDSQSHPMDYAAAGLPRDDQHDLLPSSSPYKLQDNNTPFYAQLSSISQGHHRPDHRSPAQSAPYYASHHESSSFKMGAMAGALPEYGSDMQHQSSQAVPRSLPGASTSAVVYQLGQNMQMPAHASNGMAVHPSYGSNYGANPYQQGYMPSQNPQNGVYPPYNLSQPRIQGVAPIHNPYQPYPQAPQYMYYPTSYGPQGHYPQGYAAQGMQGHTMYGRRPSLSTAPSGVPGQNADIPSHDGSTRMGHSEQNMPYYPVPGMPRSASVSSIPRGPPRKPKQSGHALWVGNLPPGTTVVSLKDHFSREATKDIESLFLISKSNCAFVNYRTEASCTAAMHRFHDSRFNGVRLVCRLRRSSAPAAGVPTGPSAMTSPPHIAASPPMSPRQNSEAIDGLPEETSESQAHENGDGTPTMTTSKYFIVKSLTLQDLELSIRNGIWATQSHNEDVLNKAYQSAENVYLIFSANKSGEYFGYARMRSPILEDDPVLVSSAPKTENIMDAPDVPKSIPTLATEWAPRGRIIDDSARGTIFWEAELSESEGEEEATVKVEPQTDGDSPVVAQSWGKPFKVEWLSANRLPFYRTRGLRNPWNANREVKIARDGTELEPSVGERLIQMFHRLGPSMPPVQLGGPIMPQMRPF